MFEMRWYWKTLWLALWLLSQTLGFARPALSSVAEQGLPFCPAGEEREAGNANFADDAGSVSCVVYDAESAPATPQALSVPVGAVATPAYDSNPVSSMRTAGAPRTPPVAKVGFVAAKTIDASKVRFSQSSIKSTFKDGGSLYDLVAGLKNGTVKPGDVPPIRLVERDGHLFTLDNRRLEAFRQAVANFFAVA